VDTQNPKHPVAATREHMRRSAHRAVDDPARLAQATRIVRAALARKRLTLDELTPLDPPTPKRAA
jgi:hypothetical protein